jgi:hypothetical protein
MANGRLKKVPRGFAINPPFTIEMLIVRGPGSKSPVEINNVLVFAAANITGAVNH